MESRLKIEENLFGGNLPTVVVAEGCLAGGDSALDKPSWRDFHSACRDLAGRYVPHSGGVLFRGFDVRGETDFREFARLFGFPLLSYEFGSTPRTALEQGVYTSTEYPPHQKIPLHNEQAYTLQWPLKIWFHCVTASPEGGETPIADSRRVYQRIDPKIRQRFEQKQLMYVRNYGNGLDVPWPQAFNVGGDDADLTFLPTVLVCHFLIRPWDHLRLFFGLKKRGFVKADHRKSKSYSKAC